MSLATILDIGTQSILYLLADISDQSITPIHQEVRSARLGEGLDSTGFISEMALDRTVKILHELKDLAEQQSARSFHAVGTQIFRKAQNRNDVLDEIMRRTGISIEILSEDEEALWSYRGAIGNKPMDGPVIAADIGGGSTEIVLGKGEKIICVNSFPIGSVILTERCFQEGPPSEREYRDIRKAIFDAFGPRGKDTFQQADTLVGIGGTITTLTALHLGLDQYDAEKVDGFPLHQTVVGKYLNMMLQQSVDERKAWLSLDPSRADIILAGTIILNNIMELGRFDHVIVSDRGLRFGILLREMEKSND